MDKWNDSIVTRGEKADRMTIEEIVNHPQFRSLILFDLPPAEPSYWEVTFESDTPLPHGMYKSIFNGVVETKEYKFYKLKA